MCCISSTLVHVCRAIVNYLHSYWQIGERSRYQELYKHHQRDRFKQAVVCRKSWKNNIPCRYSELNITFIPSERARPTSPPPPRCPTGVTDLPNMEHAERWSTRSYFFKAAVSEINIESSLSYIPYHTMTCRHTLPPSPCFVVVLAMTTGHNCVCWCCVTKVDAVKSEVDDLSMRLETRDKERREQVR